MTKAKTQMFSNIKMAKTDFFEFTKGPKLKNRSRKNTLTFIQKSYISLWFSRSKVSLISKLNNIKTGFKYENFEKFKNFNFIIS